MATEGIRVNKTMALPPWHWAGNKREFQGGAHLLATASGVPSNGGWSTSGREQAVRRVLLYPEQVNAMDGATLFAASKVTCGEDMFTDTSKVDQGKVLKVFALRAGGEYDSLLSVAQKLAPGEGPWFEDYLKEVNRRSLNNRLQETTREPERLEKEKDVARGVGASIGGKASALIRTLRAAQKGSDGRLAEKPPEYADAAIREAGYCHKGFVPGINGDDADALTRRVTAADGVVLVRVPVLPSLYERKLEGFAEKVKRRLALCIMHGGMRSSESNFKRWLGG